MPLTEIDYPILQHFLCVVESRTGMPAQPLDATPEQLAKVGQKQDEENTKPLPKGVVLGPDGKPETDGSKVPDLYISLIMARDDEAETVQCGSVYASLCYGYASDSTTIGLSARG
ncbi:Flavin-linked sulfhydryl oxidase of the mitochondrial IMS [Elasticomyces elasticus]|nr:Flavin-linked sulfhydryl oxidase of the mitochondrial IMS [Elasticomyces elasticus]